MYKYRHIITQDIIEIEDIIIDSMPDYLESSYVESWVHIDDKTKKEDGCSDNYVGDLN